MSTWLDFELPSRNDFKNAILLESATVGIYDPYADLPSITLRDGTLRDYDETIFGSFSSSTRWESLLALLQTHYDGDNVYVTLEYELFFTKRLARLHLKGFMLLAWELAKNDVLQALYDDADLLVKESETEEIDTMHERDKDVASDDNTDIKRADSPNIDTGDLTSEYLSGQETGESASTQTENVTETHSEFRSRVLSGSKLDRLLRLIGSDTGMRDAWDRYLRTFDRLILPTLNNE